jgi:hypothetical protein
MKFVFVVMGIGFLLQISYAPPALQSIYLI